MYTLLYMVNHGTQLSAKIPNFLTLVLSITIVFELIV